MILVFKHKMPQFSTFKIISCKSLPLKLKTKLTKSRCIYMLSNKIVLTQGLWIRWNTQHSLTRKQYTMFNVETLKWEKTMGEQSFTIQWIYNRGYYSTRVECISHTGLLASAVTHTTMAPLTLSHLTPLYTHNNYSLFSTSATFVNHISQFALGDIYTNTSYGLFTNVVPTTHHYYYYSYNNNSNSRQLISQLSICWHFDCLLLSARTIGSS